MLYIKKRLAQMPPEQRQFDLGKIFENLYATQCLGSAALVINAGSAVTWKMANAAALPYVINGVLASKAAATAQAVPSAVSWTGAASVFNAAGFLIALDSAGAVTTYPTNVTATASAATALSGLVWPAIPDTVCVIGGIVVTNSAANTTFTAATTALDAANITTLYFNTTGPFYPTAAF